MRLVYTLGISTILLLLSCSKEPVLDIREGMIFNPDSIQFESNEKGWELYSWKSNDIWRYSLLPGTNRVKSTDEILSNPYTVNGREQLKLIIRQIPSGETITWFGTDWVTAHVEGVNKIFKMPPLLTQYDVFHFADMNSIELTVVP